MTELWVIAAIIAWIALSALGGVIASRRGRSGIGWFLIMSLTGCASVILLFLLPRKDAI